jgi:uncharacterized protein YodC (DUF2158 family)
MDYKEGDVVRLKSGGPRMTVTATGDRMGTPSVWCTWFVGNKRDSDVFPIGAVESVDTDSSPQTVSREPSWITARRG